MQSAAYAKNVIKKSNITVSQTVTKYGYQQTCNKQH